MSDAIDPAADLPAIDILSLFPDAVSSLLNSAMLKRAQAKNKIRLEATDLRAFGEGRYRSVDDTPFGGNQGMLLSAPVLEKAFQEQLARVDGDRSRLRVIYPHPRGLQVGQGVCQALSGWLQAGPGRRMVVLCGRYEGIDERIVDRWVDLEVSVGDFILTGGELPALMLTDAVTRLLPGVLGDGRSAEEESFSQGLLEHPQYTKPREFEGQGVPEALLGGNHAQADEWKLREALLLTAAFRPDLIRQHRGRGLPFWAQELLERLQRRIDLRA
jgi:tRNA (guanine37-N1)-methyltransferase